MDENYTVYMHKNKVNNKVYIGITGRQPEERWGTNGNRYYPHQGYESHFYNSIQKYGWDNFEHIVLFTGLSRKEAEQKEISLIAEYHATNKEYGYNMTNGGSTAGFMTDEAKAKISQANRGRREIFVYDRTTGEFLCSYPTLIDAEIGLGISKSSITQVSSRRAKAIHGFIFRYADQGYVYGQPFPDQQMEVYKNTHFRPVKQYDLDGNFIQQFPSIRDAEVSFGKKQGSTLIWHCLRHKKPSAMGYLWSYQDEQPVPYKSKRQKKVAQYDESGNLIATHDSVKDAAKSIGVSSDAFNKHLKHSDALYKGSYWKYA